MPKVLTGMGAGPNGGTSAPNTPLRWLSAGACFRSSVHMASMPSLQRSKPQAYCHFLVVSMLQPTRATPDWPSSNST